MPDAKTIAASGERAAQEFAAEHQAQIEAEIARRQEQFSGSLKPTNKWIAGLVGGLLLIVVHGLASKGFDATEAGELAAVLSVAVPAYFRRNAPTPTGVPEA